MGLQSQVWIVIALLFSSGVVSPQTDSGYEVEETTVTTQIPRVTSKPAVRGTSGY